MLLRLQPPQPILDENVRINKSYRQHIQATLLTKITLD